MGRESIIFALALAACQGPPPPQPAAVAPTGPFQFPASAKSTQYAYFDADAQLVVVGRDDVPDHVRPWTAVILANQPAPPAGQMYRWLPGDDARLGSAELVDRGELERGCGAAWAAFDASTRVWDAAVAIAQPGKPRPVARTRPKRAPAAPVAAVEEPPSAIEIVEVGGDVDARTRRGARSRVARDPTPEVVAPWGWRSVTLYYSKTCGYCRQAMRWMGANNVPYRRVDVDTKAGARAQDAVAAREGIGTGVPMFEIGDERQILMGWDKERFIELAKK